MNVKKIQFLRLAPWMGISEPHPQDRRYNFTIAQVISLLDVNKYEIDFIDGYVENLNINEINKRIEAFDPNVFLLTTSSNSSKYASQIFDLLKKSKPKIFLCAFGQHAHYSPETFLNASLDIDAIVHGEPEETIVELIELLPKDKFDKNNIKGLYFWDNELIKTPDRELTINLDDWPMPKYEIFKNFDYSIVSLNFPKFRNVKAGWLLTSRGCPYQCTFCSPSIRRSFGIRLRRNSPERIADSFKYLSEQLNVNTISIADDTFSLDMKWAEEVANELIKRKNDVQFAITTRADRLNENLIVKLKAAGMIAAGIGVETGSARVMERIKKTEKLSDIENSFKLLNKYNISTNVTVIVGHIDETIEELNETFNFLFKIDPTFVQLHHLTPYPGTKIKVLFDEKYDSKENISHYNDEPLNMSKIQNELLNKSIKNFYSQYYLSWKFLKKYFNHRVSYTLAKPIKEYKLIKDSLKYFIK